MTLVARPKTIFVDSFNVMLDPSDDQAKLVARCLPMSTLRRKPRIEKDFFDELLVSFLLKELSKYRMKERHQ
jgi:hypothetical protein